MDNSLEVKLIARLIHVEGRRSTVYKDSKGLWTIGIGRLVDPSVPGAGLSEDEQVYLCRNDIRLKEAELDAAFPWFERLNAPRRLVLVELAFNMGLGNRRQGLLSFINTLPAIERGDWPRVERGLRASKWYRDVKPRRAEPLIKQLVTGEWQY